VALDFPLSRGPFALGLLVSLAVAALPRLATGTPVTSATPNVDSALTNPPGSTDFLFDHRFQVIGSKVLNSPTFDLETGIVWRLSAAVRYATSSDVGSGPNELEALARAGLLRQGSGHPLDLALEAAWNSGANSVDGAVVLARRFGRLAVSGTARAFSNGYDAGGATLAAGAGLRIRLTRYLSLAGDLNGILTAANFSQITPTASLLAWSGGIAFDIPYSPHSMSIYATNGNTRTLEGQSRGTRDFRIGFQFDIPFGSLDRWKAIFSTEAPPAEQAERPPAAGPAQQRQEAVVDIQGYAFQPAELRVKAGSVVRWRNLDQVLHTATAASGDWSSPALKPGESYSQRFDRPGTHPYYCTVHPYMRGSVVVE
jgi:plastocyanin